MTLDNLSPVSLGSWLHQLHLRRWVRLRQQVFWIWHLTISAQSAWAVDYINYISGDGWGSANKCSGYDTWQSQPSQLGQLITSTTSQEMGEAPPTSVLDMTLDNLSPVSLGSWLHQLHLRRWVRLRQQVFWIWHLTISAQSAWAVDYINYISGDGWGSPNKCSGYDTWQSQPSQLGQLITSTTSQEMGEAPPTSVLDMTLDNLSPVSLGSWLHQLHLRRWVRLPQQVFWIWHLTISAQSAWAVDYINYISGDGWGSANKCSGYDTWQSQPSQLGQLITSTTSQEMGEAPPTSVLDMTLDNLSPVSLGSWLHQLHLRRWVRLPQQVFWIWHLTISAQSAWAADYINYISGDGWGSANKCSGYDTWQSQPSQLGQLITSTTSQEMGEAPPTSVLDMTLDNLSPVSLGSWLHQLHLRRWVRLRQQVFWIWHLTISAQSAWAVDYINYISGDGWGSANKCPGYDAKQSDDKAPVMLVSVYSTAPANWAAFG